MTGGNPNSFEERRESEGSFASFLKSYWDDVDAGTVRSLREYLNEFPEPEIQIAEEYLAIYRPTRTEASEPDLTLHNVPEPLRNVLKRLYEDWLRRG